MDALNFSEPVSAKDAGLDAAALTHLADLFHAQISSGLHPAAQMVVIKDGQVLFDQAAGQFRGGKPVRANTPFYCFSVSKAFTGMCIHKLIEEGKVALDAPVAEYWPAFGKKGKDKITIKQVFHHTAGIPAIDRYRQIPLWPFWPLVTADVANLTPEYPPNSRMAYHAVSWGFIFGEVIRRVSGLPRWDAAVAFRGLHSALDVSQESGRAASLPGQVPRSGRPAGVSLSTKRGNGRFSHALDHVRADT